MKFLDSSKLIKIILQEALQKYLSLGNESKNFIPDLADSLLLMPNTLRKKISGTKSFSINELEQIINNFDIKVSINSSNNSDLQFVPIAETTSSINSYFIETLRQLNAISNWDIKNMRLTCEDIPFFYYFEFKHLTAFKIFFYDQTIFRTKGQFNALYVEKKILCI